MAFERIATHGVVTFAMRRSHHIACLATLAKQATDRGYIAILATSDPAFGFVAPYGGREPLFTPNPFAIGYPGTHTPVLVDICASITTVSMTRQKAAIGEAFDISWLLDAEGRPTWIARAPEQTEPRGSLLLLGWAPVRPQGVRPRSDGRGTHPRPVRPRPQRHREALGRQRLPAGPRSGCLRRPRGLPGADGRLLTERCQANAPLREGVPVRMPGEQAERSIAAASEQGVPLAEHTVQRLGGLAERFGLVMPAAL